MRTRTCAALAAISLLLVSGCDDEATEPVSISCDLPNNGGDIAGSWTISAKGKRTDCDDRRYEGSLAISTTMPVAVSAKARATPNGTSEGISETGPDAFVERIERGDYELGLRSAVDNLDLQGQASSSCVTFTVTEQVGKDELIYWFDGEISDTNYIQGNFLGEGPRNCKVAGSFTVDIR